MRKLDIDKATILINVSIREFVLVVSKGDKTSALRSTFNIEHDNWIDFGMFGQLYRLNIDYDVSLTVAIYKDYIEDGYRHSNFTDWLNPSWVIVFDSYKFDEWIASEITKKQIQLELIEEY